MKMAIYFVLILGAFVIVENGCVGAILSGYSTIYLLCIAAFLSKIGLLIENHDKLLKLV
jgi:hypothetical protein